MLASPFSERCVFVQGSQGSSRIESKTERSEAHCSGTGETLVVWLGASREPFPPRVTFLPLNPPIGSITASASTI